MEASMNPIARRLFATLVLFCSAVATLAVDSSLKLKEISGYREWKPISEQPFPVNNPYLAVA